MNTHSEQDYPRVIEWDWSEGCFVGSAPPLLLCVSGQTRGETLAKLDEAIRFHVESLCLAGMELPEPLHLAAA